MQEGDLRIVGRRAAVLVGRAVGVDPAVRHELLGVGAPEARGAVDGPRGEDDEGVLRHAHIADEGVADAEAAGDGDGWIEAQGFGTDAREERELVDVDGGRGDATVRIRESCANLCAKASLDLGVLGEEVEDP